MTMKRHTRIDLVEGGNIFKQGEHVKLSYAPRDSNGDIVDLSDKDISVVIWNRKGVMYEGSASYDVDDELIRMMIEETLAHGEFNIEFTATSSTDPSYRQKFPSSEYEGRLLITPSAENMDVVGVQMTTVAQLKADQKADQEVFEAAVIPRVETVESKTDELEQRVNNGIGAFTEDTEVLDARMGEANLREFNRKTTEKLADKEALEKQYDYVDYLTKSANLSRKMTVKMDNPLYKYFYVNIPTSDKDGVSYLFGKDSNDDYQLLLNVDFGDLVKTTAVTENKNNETESLTAAKFDKGFPPNYYTLAIGDWIAATFTGTKIAFNSLCSNVGGLWEAILDEGKLGEQRKNISVYNATSVTKQQVLFEGLDYGKHSIKMVFKGQDPANPVTSPRGWWLYGGTRPQDIARTFDVFNETSYINKTIEAMYGYTVKEFALSCRPFGSTEPFVYVPEHSAPTAFKLEEPVLLLDGKEPIWNSGTIYNDIETVQLIQKLKGIHPSDTANPLMEVNIIQTIKNGVYSVSGRVKFLRKTELDTGYAIMFSYPTSFGKKVKTGLGEIYPVKTDGTKTNLLYGDQENSFVVVNDVDTAGRKNLAIACTVDNSFKTHRKGKLFRGDPFAWIEHRNTTMGKIYMQQFKNAVIEAGDEYRFDGRYTVVKIQNVNDFVLDS